jgi:hypothetical protein
MQNFTKENQSQLGEKTPYAIIVTSVLIYTIIILYRELNSLV